MPLLVCLPPSPSKAHSACATLPRFTPFHLYLFIQTSIGAPEKVQFYPPTASMAAPGGSGPVKGNSGWGDPKALAAARELAQSFKSSSGKSQGQPSRPEGRSGARSLEPLLRVPASRREHSSNLSNAQTDHRCPALDRGHSTRQTQRSVNQHSYDNDMDPRLRVQRPSGRKVIAGDAMAWLKATTSGNTANENIKGEFSMLVLNA